MLKGLGDIGNLMKMQKELKSIQKRITGTEKEGVSANGRVKAAVNGEYRLKGLSIDPELIITVSARDVEKMVIEAVNDAVEKMKVFSAQEMKRLTGGLDVPGLGDFFK
jgi:nucleoid-associated protein EbfC